MVALDTDKIIQGSPLMGYSLSTTHAFLKIIDNSQWSLNNNPLFISITLQSTVISHWNNRLKKRKKKKSLIIS